MSEVTLREHALRVAVLKVISDEAVRAYKAAREDAQADFGPARDDGQSQQRSLLPDGTEIGLISVKAPEKSVDVADGVLEKWVREHVPDGMEDCVDSAAANSAEVLDVLRAVFPDLVKSRIRPATRTALLKEIEESGGYLVDSDGVKEKVGEVTDLKATGEFTFRPGKAARDAVIAAWRRGELQGSVPFALPGAPDVAPAEPGRAPGRPEESPAAERVMFGPPFCDEHGFRDPVLAAAHALMVQDGFTTPPIEAHRMLRGGGVAAERAAAWLAEVGLDPADPQKGRGTPWPLPEAGAM